MYAIIKADDKQYKVVAGEKLKVEQIPADAGAEVTLDQVLVVGVSDQLRVGASLVSGAAVKATIISHGCYGGVHIFRMRRRKYYQKRQGHRQNHTELCIDSIVT